jgi:hypothetical protein
MMALNAQLVITGWLLVSDTPIIITFTVWNRPHYLKQVLESWSHVRGIENAILEFHCEPGCPESVKLCTGVNFTEYRVIVNTNQLGATLNACTALNSAFESTDYAILAADDFLPSTDALELHAWHRNNYRDDPSVLALVLGRGAEAPGGLSAVWRSQVMGWIPGFHRSKWALLSPRWMESDGRPGGWYFWVDEEWCFTRGYDVLLPARSRAQDIGEVGSYPLPFEFSRIQSPSFVPDCSPQEYCEVQGRRERGIDQRIEEY